MVVLQGLQVIPCIKIECAALLDQLQRFLKVYKYVCA